MELVNVLLDFGANVNQVTDEGLCVLSLCLLYYYRVMEQLNPDRLLQPHIISTVSENSSTSSDGSLSPPKEPLNGDACFTRPYVYRAEVSMFLSDSSLEDRRMLEEQARLSQFRRIYGIRSEFGGKLETLVPVLNPFAFDNKNSFC